MNRTGLLVALALALVIELLFGIYPELDLKLAALFYDPATRSFPLKFNSDAEFARDAAMWFAWALALPALAALVIKLLRPNRRLLISGRAVVFLLITLILAAGVLTNFTFKSYWGRPRPVVVAQFNGPQAFVPWWDPRGTCAHNCSFFSGEGATAFWTYAPAVLTPPAVRPLALAAATLFGVGTSVLRMAFGGHFFTDVATAGLVTFLAIWLAYAYIYRWPPDPPDRRGNRRRADAVRLARLSTMAALARSRCRAASASVNRCTTLLFEHDLFEKPASLFRIMP